MLLFSDFAAAELLPAGVQGVSSPAELLPAGVKRRAKSFAMGLFDFPDALWPVFAVLCPLVLLRSLAMTEKKMQMICAKAFLEKPLRLSDVELALGWAPHSSAITWLVESGVTRYALSTDLEVVYYDVCRMQLLLGHQRRLRRTPNAQLTVSEALGLLLGGRIGNRGIGRCCIFFLTLKYPTRRHNHRLMRHLQSDISSTLASITMAWSENTLNWCTLNVETLIELLSDVGDSGFVYLDHDTQEVVQAQLAAGMHTNQIPDFLSRLRTRQLGPVL